MKIIKHLLLSVFVSAPFFVMLHAAETPEIFATGFEENKPIRAQVITVVPPKEYGLFIQRLSEAASKSPEWFNAHIAKSPSDSPFPEYDEKLGMTQEEFANYIKLWDSREVKKLADTALLLEKIGEKEWKINGTGVAAPLSLLRYHAEKNIFISPNGELASIANVKTSPRSVLGAWSGKEWRFQATNSLTTMRENVALGKSADGKYGYLIYRLQEIVTKSGKPLADKRLILRFAAKAQP